MSDFDNLDNLIYNISLKITVLEKILIKKGVLSQEEYLSEITNLATEVTDLVKKQYSQD